MPAPQTHRGKRRRRWGDIRIRKHGVRRLVLGGLFNSSLNADLFFDSLTASALFIESLTIGDFTVGGLINDRLATDRNDLHAGWLDDNRRTTPTGNGAVVAHAARMLRPRLD